MRISASIIIAAHLVFSGTVAAQDRFTAPSADPVHSSVYTEATDGERITIVAREWETAGGGLMLESTASSGERHVVLVTRELATVAWRFGNDAESAQFEVEAVDQSMVRVTTTTLGEESVGYARLNEPLWIQSLERSLRRFVMNGSEGDRLRFSVVQPDTLSTRTLQARIMADETVAVGTSLVPARRVRISLPGIGVLVWRSDYWFRLTDGLFAQSRVTRGPPGTPETVVSLVSDSGPVPHQP